MVLTRINLKLIKCDFWLDFILFHFLKEIIIFFLFTASYLLFWKIFGDMIHEKFKIQNSKFKKKKAQKTSLSSAATWIAFLAWKTLKFGFLYFYKSYRKLNFLSKNIIPNQLEFWAASYGQNKKQMQKITQTQHYLQFSLKISNADQQ